MAFEGKTVLITGASRGIGESAARLYAEAGANVVLMARSGAQVGQIAKDIGAQARAVSGDVSNWNDIVHAVKVCTDTFGGLDILINNAGVIEPIAPILNSDPEGWTHAVDINLNGPYFGIRAAAPVMAAAGGGTIITISSGAAHNPLEGWSHYCTSKAGAAMLTRCADLELRGKGLRVMGLSPGTVATQMQREIKVSGINPVAQLDWSDHIPTDWVAKCLLWMSGPAGDTLRGQEVSLRDETVRKQVGLA
ncbi:SDR family oxidoreductase [Thalassovita sp.]|uniref:SDR family oxidoreductase n=1 Tax=Thalassovita sp. TaxID=1979401 RepID=UPI0029DE7EC7|nr:SDR family oxidoreductase [Thalassovita sp.]